MLKPYLTTYGWTTVSNLSGWRDLTNRDDWGVAAAALVRWAAQDCGGDAPVDEERWGIHHAQPEASKILLDTRLVTKMVSVHFLLTNRRVALRPDIFIDQAKELREPTFHVLPASLRIYRWSWMNCIDVKLGALCPHRGGGLPQLIGCLSLPVRGKRGSNFQYFLRMSFK